MADQKISELTALTGANVADDDAIAIVDTSATETKKIVFSELKNALDTATGFVRITGDTMTGALDVQSTITSDGLTVGGGGSDAVVRIDTEVADKSDWRLRASDSGSEGELYIEDFAGSTWTPAIKFSHGGDISFYEDTGTTPKFFWDASAESLGIGTTSPSAYGAGYTTVGVNGSTMSGVEGFVNGTLTSYTQTYAAQTLVGTKTATPLIFVTDDTQRMRIDASGSVGIGVVPETWNSLKALQINSQASVSADASSIQLGANCYYNSGWKYINGAAATNYYQDSGVHVWRTAASGSADTAISWSEAMRIDSSGNLLVGKTALGIDTNGFDVRPTGETGISVDDNIVLDLNRTSEDGKIINLRKDDVTVGSIGIQSGGLTIDGESGHSGLRFGGSDIVPRDNGADVDAGIQLGNNIYRFTDLYLSGTIEIENGTANVGVGKQALNSNTSSYNTAVGYQAGYSNTTGNGNVFLGYTAGQDLTEGVSSVYVGAFAGRNIQTGSGNTVVGRTALQTGTTCGNSVAIGNDALELATGNDNTAVGSRAGSNMTTGSKNTILGRYNGNQGGLDIRTSSNNIVLSDGDGNPRVLVDSSGNMLVGMVTTSGLGSTTSGNYFAANGNSNIVAVIGTGSNKVFQWYNANGEVGSILTSGSSTSYNTSSDYRLKENVVAMTGATTRLKQLNPSRFNFIADADTTVDGFLAHEVQAVVPEAIHGTKDEVDADGNPVYQGIDQSKLVPLLVATIQELEARITALENA